MDVFYNPSDIAVNTPPRRSALAGAAFVMALSSPLLQVLTAVPAIYLGIAALREVNSSDGKIRGRSIAVSAIVLGIFVCVLDLLAVAALVVQNVREKSNRAECANNLRRIAQAVISYETTAKVYPLATIPNPQLTPEKRLSWLAAIVPFFDLNAAGHAQRIELGGPLEQAESWNSQGNEGAAKTNVRVFLCLDQPYYDRTTQPGWTSYVGFTGVGADAATYDKKDPRSGVFGYDRLLRPADVKAGQAETLLSGETSWHNGPWIAGGELTARGIDPAPPATERWKDIGIDRPFGGQHAGGMNVAKLDGSVQFMNDNIEPALFRTLTLVNR